MLKPITSPSSGVLLAQTAEYQLQRICLRTSLERGRGLDRMRLPPPPKKRCAWREVLSKLATVFILWQCIYQLVAVVFKFCPAFKIIIQACMVIWGFFGFISFCFNFI